MFFPGVLLMEELQKSKNPNDDILLWRLFMILLALMVAFRATKADNNTSAAQALFFSAALIQWMQ
jgi:hypothetical protein